MKPLNLDNSPCSPTSSNCVIWQGPDLTCIKLCTGDTVSDVIAKLATELCTIMDELKISNYDLTCLGITTCPPSDFAGLIQLLINKICELNGTSTDLGKSTATTGCPDCVVSVASCFIVGNQTTMQLLDYVNMIATRVCSILNELQLINDSIDNLINITNSLQVQIDSIPVYQLPSITLGCAIGGYPSGSQVSLDNIIDEFLNTVWCSFVSATGTSSELLSAVAQKCVLDTTLQLANGLPFSANADWILDTNYNSVADAINNLWVVLCDLRSFVSVASFNVTDTNTINLTYTAGTLTAAVQDTGWVRLNGFDFIPDSNTQTPPQVRRIGNVLHFKGAAMIPLVNGASALTWDYSAGVDSYFLNNTVTPFQGIGGVLLNSSGGITFNNNGAGSCDPVIPASVIPPGWALDDRYINPAGWKMMSRIIPISSSDSTFLSTFVSQGILANGNLVLGLIKDAEATTVGGRGGAGSYDTSHMNTVISHVVAGHYVPKYSSASTELYDNAASGAQPVAIDYQSTHTYPFSCNANDETQLGGFNIRLDGLTAFISPCDRLLPTPDPCSI
jgi:hypothetical protein